MSDPKEEDNSRSQKSAVPAESEDNRKVFGVPLTKILEYAAMAIRATTEQDDSIIFGYIPIIVGKLGAFQKYIPFHRPKKVYPLNGDAYREELMDTLDSPPSYGVGTSLDDCRKIDASIIFLKYFNKLPESAVPLANVQHFLEPLKSHQNKWSACQAPADFDKKDALKQYEVLINSLQPPNRSLLLYMLDMLAVMTANYRNPRLQSLIRTTVSGYQPGLLRIKGSSRPKEDTDLAVYVLCFLVVNQKSFEISQDSTILLVDSSTDNSIYTSRFREVDVETDSRGSLVTPDASQNSTKDIPNKATGPGTDPVKLDSKLKLPEEDSDLNHRMGSSLTIQDDNVKTIVPEVSQTDRSTGIEVSPVEDQDTTLIPPGQESKTSTQFANNNTKPDIAKPQSSALDSMFRLHKEHNNVFSETEISRVAQVLQETLPSWSVIPRIYIVLRLIGCLDICDTILKSGFSDYELPVSQRDLPKQLSAEDQSHFLTAQKLVLTKIIDLERGAAGQHHHFDIGDSFPFEIRERLGDGGFGQVDKVISLNTRKEFALKRYTRKSVSTGKGLAGLRGIIAEIGILKTLTHRHIIRFVGSYTDQKYLGLLMTPVAELDFSVYLEQATSVQHSSIRSFFGCLTAGLGYLHTQKIRHKDIKPGNILVSQGSVLLTDFGLARDFEDALGSTSVGPVNGTSPRYAAPEVLMMESRNTKSDIWSLGIVFLEMIVVLKNKTKEWMDEFMSSHGFENKFVRNNSPGFQELVVVLQQASPQADNIALEWVKLMLHEQHTQRPSAAELLDKIIYSTEDRVPNSRFCGLCCREEDSDSSDDSR